MNLIPEDSMLRRHYLTELKSRQDRCFEKMTKATQPSAVAEVVEPDYYPFWSNEVIIPLIAFAFFMAVIFV